MNKNPLKNQQREPLRNDMRKNFNQDVEIADEITPEGPLSAGELPVVAGLKTRKLVELGEEMLIDKYRKKNKK